MWKFRGRIFYLRSEHNTLLIANNFSIRILQVLTYCFKFHFQCNKHLINFAREITSNRQHLINSLYVFLRCHLDMVHRVHLNKHYHKFLSHFCDLTLLTVVSEWHHQFHVKTEQQLTQSSIRKTGKSLHTILVVYTLVIICLHRVYFDVSKPLWIF